MSDSSQRQLIFPVLLVLFAGLFITCTGESNQENEGEIAISWPAHFPDPEIPADNLPTAKRIALGQKMFFDASLSVDSTVACVSCHRPPMAFTDRRAKSLGVEQRLGKRNAPSLINAAYLQHINKDGGVKNLDIQALVPLEDENEMNITIPELVRRLNQDAEYVSMSHAAYGRAPDAFVVTRALASFVRSLVGGSSRYDTYLLGDSTAITEKEKRGLALFTSDRLNCDACHSSVLFDSPTFENNGLYEHYEDVGRALISLDPQDNGKFRVPSLRNVMLTAPYMHDGSLKTIEEVLDHYQNIDNDLRPMASEKLRAFSLSKEEREALIAFFRALSDQKKL